MKCKICGTEMQLNWAGETWHCYKCEPCTETNKKVSSCCGAEVGIDEHPFATSHANAFICYKCKKYCERVEQEPEHKLKGCKCPEGSDVRFCLGEQEPADWKKEFRLLMGKVVGWREKEVDYPLEDFISTQITKAEKETWSAQQMLWDRMENWQNEWVTENPKERKLIMHDALKLIEWKIAKAKKEGFSEGQKYALGLDEERVRQFEDHNFKVNSKGWKKIKVDGESYLENPEGDIWEILEGKAKGEQLFTYDATMRETKKAGKRIQF